MTQYLIFLKNETEENCYLITSNRDNAIERLADFRDIIKRDNAWFELREYENGSTPEYKVLM